MAKKKKRAANRYSGKNHSVVPNFEGWEDLNGEQFYRLKTKIHDYYHFNYAQKDLLPFIWEWMEGNGYSKNEIAKVKDSSILGIGINCKLLLEGCPDYHEEESLWCLTIGMNKKKPISEFIKSHISVAIENFIEESKSEIVKDEKKNTPNVQDRNRDITYEKLEEMNNAIDNWPKIKLSDFNVIKYFQKNEMNQGNFKFIEMEYQGPYDEIKEVMDLPDEKNEEQEQLAEVYHSYSKTQIKDLYNFYKKIFETIEKLKPIKKIKEKRAEDVIKKLKFKLNDAQLGITSIDPINILKSTILIVFNCKNRKIGIFYAENNKTFGIKGNTIFNFDPDKSIQKTIRKPLEDLDSWKNISKLTIKKHFDPINATETKLNDKFTADIVILKSF